jgi:exonuclease VII small subunit
MDDPLDEYDTPTERANINQVSVDALDNHLIQLRQRRLVLVQRLEVAAKVRADSVRLTAFLKLEKAMASANRAIKKLEEQETKVEKLVHRCRLLAMAAQMEVDDGSSSEGT